LVRDDAKAGIRELLLEGILPSPVDPLEVRQLSDFKQKYKEPLQRFRSQVEDRVSEIAVIPDEEGQRARLRDSIVFFNDTIAEITARMQEQRNWPRLEFSTLCALIGFGLGAWDAASGQNWRFGLTKATVSLAPAIYNAVRGLKPIYEHQPLAYAALVKSQLQA
jgi:hypothetical protein